MPIKRRPRRRRRRAAKKTGAPITGAPRMTRSLRVHQNLTRDCRWFKGAGTIQSNPLGDFRHITSPGGISTVLDFSKWGSCWEEFKVLKVILTLLPVSVGSESLLQTAPGQPSPLAPLFKRGNVIIYLDQGKPDTASNDFVKLITKPSARLVPARRTQKRWIDRPKGHPAWGNFDPNGSINDDDSWQDSYIHVIGQGFTPLIQSWYYYTVAYKVLFRGRARQE